jgi:hypothetical protein
MMQGRTWTAAILGSALGGALGIGALALVSARTIHSGLAFPEAGGGPAFVVGRGPMTLYLLIAGALAGLILGAIGYAAGRSADPTERRYGAGPLIALGALTGSMVAFAATRTTIGALASILEGVVTISVFRASIVALVSGAVTGAVVAVAVERMSRPQLFRFGGEAWPAHLGAFIRDSATAIGIPMVAVGVGAAVVFGLSRVLLGTSHLVALIIFSAAAALVLFGAAAVAARKPGRSSDQ